nr:serine/threonine-protein kinase [Kineosphaera limosa]
MEQRRQDAHAGERGAQPAKQHERLGEYRLVQRLGEGGMGVVHLGVDDRGRAVAIKVLRDHVAHDPVARARLAREVATLRRVRHPRVAPVLAADTDGPRPYVVTRYVPGDPLDTWVAAHGPMDAAGLARLGRGLAEALGAIHAAGVVHRDLKPGNVLIAAGDPVVIDFGIAHVADEARLTNTGLIMGTPGYLAPELLDGHPVDDSTDWWAWAATLLFAATGRPPFGTGRLDAVLHRVHRGEADLRGVPERLRPVLLAGLRPEAHARPRQEEILAALDVFAAGGDTAAIVGPAPRVGTDSSLASDQDFGDPTTRPVPPPRRGLAQTVAQPAIALGAALGLRKGDGTPVGEPGATSRAPAAAGSAAVGSAAGDSAAAASSAGGSAGGAASGGSVAAGAGAPRAARDATEPHTRPQPVSSTRALPTVDPAAPHVGVAGNPVGRPQAPLQHNYVGFRGPQTAPAAANPAGYQAHPAAAAPAGPQPVVKPARRTWWGGRAKAGAAPAPVGASRAAQRPYYEPRPYGAPQFGSPPRPAAFSDPAHVNSGPRLRHSVQLPLLTLLGALCGLAMTYPVVAVLVAAGWSVLARTVEASSLAIFSGAAERGRRRSDVPIAILMSPFRALPAVLTTALVMIVSGVVAAGAAIGIAVLLTGATGIAMTVESEPVLAGAMAVGVLVGWWGPAGATLRRGSRRTMRVLTLHRLGALCVSLVLGLVGAYFAVRSQASGIAPDWYPLAESFAQSLLRPF